MQPPIRAVTNQEHPIVAIVNFLCSYTGLYIGLFTKETDISKQFFLLMINPEEFHAH